MADSPPTDDQNSAANADEKTHFLVNLKARIVQSKPALNELFTGIWILRSLLLAVGITAIVWFVSYHLLTITLDSYKGKVASLENQLSARIERLNKAMDDVKPAISNLEKNLSKTREDHDSIKYSLAADQRKFTEFNLEIKNELLRLLLAIQLVTAPETKLETLLKALASIKPADRTHYVTEFLAATNRQKDFKSFVENKLKNKVQRLPAEPRSQTSVIQSGVDSKATKQSSLAINSLLVTDLLEPVMIFIKGSCFVMGSPADEPRRDDDEIQHRVCIDDFYIGKYEVSNAEYRQFVTIPSDQDQKPVVKVTWNDAVAYANWLSQRTGKAYRLPTEAEWEYACRAGTTTLFSVGDEISRSQANYGYTNTISFAVAVGSLPANPWGLHEMHGNVWEWVQDWYGNYAMDQVENPLGPEVGSRRVRRGGSYDYVHWLARCASRSAIYPGYRFHNMGFRLSRMISPSD